MATVRETSLGSRRGERDDESVLREALRRAMHLVRAHPPEDQRLFQSMLVHVMMADDEEEVSDAIDTMVEILMDGEGSSPAAVVPFEQPPIKEDEAGEDARPKTRRLRAWTDCVSLRIAKAREKRGWTQQQLAERAGLTQSHVCRIEKGVHSPSRKTLVKIAEALEVSLGDIDPVD